MLQCERGGRPVTAVYGFWALLYAAFGAQDLSDEAATTSLLGSLAAAFALAVRVIATMSMGEGRAAAAEVALHCLGCAGVAFAACVHRNAERTHTHAEKVIVTIDRRNRFETRRKVGAADARSQRFIGSRARHASTLGAARIEQSAPIRPSPGSSRKNGPARGSVEPSGSGPSQPQ